MEPETDKKYILEDIMKKRRKDQEAIENKIKSKLSLKAKRAKKQDAVKNPEKFIKQYRAAQKSYAYLKNKSKRVSQSRIGNETDGFKKLIVAVRIRGVQDISDQQKSILNRLNLKNINSAVFLKGTAANLRQLKRVENYITYGEPSLKVVKELIFKKMFGKVGNERVPIKTNELVEQHIGGDVICLEDVVNEVAGLGPHFKKITEFMYPFKLTTPPNTLMSRMRKPVSEGGHWGYRGTDIDEYILNMI